MQVAEFEYPSINEETKEKHDESNMLYKHLTIVEQTIVLSKKVSKHSNICRKIIEPNHELLEDVGLGKRENIILPSIESESSFPL